MSSIDDVISLITQALFLSPLGRCSESGYNAPSLSMEYTGIGYLLSTDCVNQAFMVELLQRNPLLKDTNKKKRLAWAKNHHQ